MPSAFAHLSSRPPLRQESAPSAGPLPRPPASSSGLRPALSDRFAATNDAGGARRGNCLCVGGASPKPAASCLEQRSGAPSRVWTGLASARSEQSNAPKHSAIGRSLAIQRQPLRLDLEWGRMRCEGNRGALTAPDRAADGAWLAGPVMHRLQPRSQKESAPAARASVRNPTGPVPAWPAQAPWLVGPRVRLAARCSLPRS